MNRRHFGLGVAALLGVSAARPALATERMVKIGAPQDFTRVYTFVTHEYSQGQRDLYTQVASLNEARRNGIRLDRTITHAWLSESDIDAAGRAESTGVLKFELAASGRESRLIQEILAEVVDTGRGVGPNDKVGTTYYNLGVMSAAIVVEGIRRAAELAPGGDPTGEWLNAACAALTTLPPTGCCRR